MAHLVPLVLDDAWVVAEAAAQLRGWLYHEVVLRRVRARVLSASTGRSSSVAQRLVATLDLALSSGLSPEEPASVVVAAC
jgi:hypothetical protein